MKREGRMHGSYVKLRKNQPEGSKAPAKPNSQSRITGRCPGNKARCNVCPAAAGHPTQKAVGIKTKGELKAKDNGNHRLEEWRVCYSFPCPSSIDGAAVAESPSFDCDDFEYYSDYEESASEAEDGEMNSEEARENHQRTSDMVLPIESFLRTMRRVRRLPPVREVASEEGSGHESGADSDSSWSGVDLSEVERSCADLDDWCVVG